MTVLGSESIPTPETKPFWSFRPSRMTPASLPFTVIEPWGEVGQFALNRDDGGGVGREDRLVERDDVTCFRVRQGPAQGARTPVK
jgi:hypothetical protein